MAQRRQTGFSLVELMVGMVLGIMLIAGAVTIYLASQRSYVEVEQVAAVSENARFAQQMVDDSLRHAGFFGEVTATMVEQDPNLTDVVGDCTTPAAAGAHDMSQFVIAARASAASVLGGCITDAYVPASPNTFRNDVLVVKHVVPRPLTDSARPNVVGADDGVIGFGGSGTLQADKTYVMTNNVSGLMFDGADTPPDISPGGAMPNSSAWEYLYEIFYVRLNPATGIPQLSRRFLEWNGTAMELQTEDIAEGVEYLRLMFGFDADGDGEVDQYTDVNGVTDWSRVDSVEVYMLVRNTTTDEQYADEKTYQLGNNTVTPGDKFRRVMVFTSMSMRNRQLIIRGGA